MNVPSKVYILFQSNYDEFIIVGVYYSIFLCCKKKEELEELHKGNNYSIEEYEIIT